MRVVRAMGYFDPRLLFEARREIPGRVIIVMGDVMHTGGLLKRIEKRVMHYKPRQCIQFAPRGSGEKEDYIENRVGQRGARKTYQ